MFIEFFKKISRLYFNFSYYNFVLNSVLSQYIEQFKEFLCFLGTIELQHKSWSDEYGFYNRRFNFGKSREKVKLDTSFRHSPQGYHQTSFNIVFSNATIYRRFQIYNNNATPSRPPQRSTLHSKLFTDAPFFFLFL